MTPTILHVKSVVLALDQTFGTMRLLPENGRQRLAGIDVLPAAATAIEQIKTLGLPIALLLPDPSAGDIAQQLKQFLPSFEEIVCSTDELGTTLASCSRTLRTDAKHTLFVAADRVLRGAAVNSGYPAAPHPLIAAGLARGCSLQFVHITGNRERFRRLREVVPYHWERLENGSWSLLGVLSRASIAEAIAARLTIEALPLDIAIEDPLFVRLDRVNKHLVNDLEKHKVLYSDGIRMLIALKPSESNDALAIHGPHGYLQFLAPSPELVETPTSASFHLQACRLALSKLPAEKLKVTRVHIDPETIDRLLLECPSTSASFQSDVDRYRGATALDSSGAIVSRHILHPDNQRVVQALLDEFNAMGYSAYTHDFTHEGRTLKNVVADLPGTGYFRIDPDIITLMRKIFIRFPLPDPPDPWLKSITELMGAEFFKDRYFNDTPPLQLRQSLEQLFQLRSWFPWWLKSYSPPGFGAQIVLVGCHLDSTAADDAGYDAHVDPAPGADDDASGIAATLAVARHLSAYKGKMTHTVRFCFFNAEEQGMVGSKSYAAALKAAGAPVKAAICMDMIGYNSDAARIFEVHAGYTDPAIRDLSVPIADSIVAWTNSLGALAPAQVYKGTSGAGGTDRNLYDGAINRSDHASFHQQGYAAVAVSEDFFANMPTESGADPNPYYHRNNDTLIDSSYASDITCAVAYAVKELAGG